MVSFCSEGVLTSRFIHRSVLGDAMAPTPCCSQREQCPGPGTSPPALVLERSLYWNAFLGYSLVCSFMSCKVGRSGFAGSVGSLFILLVPPKWA